MSMDDLKAEILSALSKLVSKTSLLFLEQIELLVSFLSREHAILVKTRALRCLYILFGGGSCNFLASKSILSTLFNILDDNEFPLELQCLTLQILQKIFSTRLLVPIRETSDLFKLVGDVEIVGTSNIKKRLALRLLVDILCSMKEAGKEQCSSSARWLSSIAQSQGSSPSIPLNFSEYRPAQLISIVSSSIMDQVNSLVKEMICSCRMELNCIKNLKRCCESFEFKKELKILLNHILCLAQQYPSAGLVALSRMRCIVQPLVGMLNGANTEIREIACEKVSLKEGGCEKDDRVFGPLKSDRERITVVSEILLCICRFVNACLNILQGTSSITSEVLHIVKDLVNCIKQCEYSCYDSHEIFCLNLHSFFMCDGFEEGKWRKLKNGDHNICWLHQECGALDFTKKMLRKGNFWEVYRAGKYSCLKGLWFAATFSFRKLIDVIKSDDYTRWIKALMLFSGAESEIKLLLFPKVSLELIRRFQLASDSDQPLRCNEGETDVFVGEGYDLNAFGENLVRICHRIHSTEKVLEASTNLSGIFFFQRWFLHLRGKFLENVVETLGLLSSYTLTEDKFKEGTKANPINATKFLQDTYALLYSLARVSFQLNCLARSYDHLATSFMDIDAVSFRSISRLGISCSALAFCTSFAINFLSSPTFKNIISCANNLEMFSNVKIVQDLAERLWDIDYAMARKLMHFLLVKEEIKHGFCSIAQIHSSGLFDNASLLLFQSAINGILDVQTDLDVAKDVEDLITIISRGLQLLCCFIMKWMEIPLLTPKYFFRVRPCISSELFIYHANSEHRDELFVRPGFQLPLNLCIQLKNASSMNCASIIKIYCVLAVKASDRFATENGRRLAAAQCAFQAHKGEEMVWLNDILLQFLRANNKETEKEHDVVVDNVSLLATCVCFEPNKMGLGFSTCLLNVSQLPVGSYPIKWHSCCVDDHGFYWNLIPSNSISVFTIKN